ncbi:MotA/TolQ/ExbB proton channel family protein [Psittacicella hinzii]|nr:MotA/TolQ/ExbB proton channel family protein [Psittacicella hinzii]
MSLLFLFDIFLKASLMVQIIMVILLSLSIWSWTLVVNRFFYYRKVRKQDMAFSRIYAEGVGFAKLISFTEQQKSLIGMARVFAEGVSSYKTISNIRYQTPEALMDLINRKMASTIAEEIEDQDFGLNILSIITGISPYIGLFGTVWGIIEVFTSLGSAEQVNIQLIAPGISEALVATAMGLFVAIPALVFYNIFNRKVNFNETNYYNFQDTFTAVIQEDVHRRLRQANAQATQPTNTQP